MNALAATLLWCFVQVTLVCLLAALAGVLLRRRPGAVAVVTRITIASVLTLTLASAAPVPSWFSAPDAAAPAPKQTTSVSAPSSGSSALPADSQSAARQSAAEAAANNDLWLAGLEWGRELATNVDPPPAIQPPGGDVRRSGAARREEPERQATRPLANHQRRRPSALNPR
jgi:hypothetical protein